MAIKYLDAKRIRALSSDTLPTNVPIGTVAELTNTYKYKWFNGTDWIWKDASILSLGGATDGDLLVSYSDASGWGSALATYPFNGGMFACAGNAVNAQFAQGHYTNGQSYKYYGSSILTVQMLEVGYILVQMEEVVVNKIT